MKKHCLNKQCCGKLWARGLKVDGWHSLEKGGGADGVHNNCALSGAIYNSHYKKQITVPSAK